MLKCDAMRLALFPTALVVIMFEFLVVRENRRDKTGCIVSEVKCEAGLKEERRRARERERNR